MLALPDPEALRDGIAALTQRVLASAQAAYGTVLTDGTPALVSHTFRVAVAPCTACGRQQRIFPHALVSLTSRVERNLPEAFLACPAAGKGGIPLPAAFMPRPAVRPTVRLADLGPGHVGGSLRRSPLPRTRTSGESLFASEDTAY